MAGLDAREALAYIAAMLAPSAPAAKLSDDLLAWYAANRRHLPWRQPPGRRADPYAVWLSEIMLQQTVVKAATPYFLKFLALWPTVAALAAAPTEAVMQAWAGLGYYSRARNLHACAQAVAREHGGRFPAEESALLRLPGIGPYTAAAIAAIAFGRHAVVVDGNVERVVSRLFAIGEPLPRARPAIRAAAASLTPRLHAGDFAQAMMDLGATICTPRKPACSLCPISLDCMARKGGAPETYPRKAKKAARPARAGAVYYVRRGGRVLLRTRPPMGLLGGMAEFPGTEWSGDFDPETAVAPLPGSFRRLPETVEHVFTHFSLTLHVFAGGAAQEQLAGEGWRWVEEAGLEAEALPSVMRKVAALARKHF